MNFIPKVFLFIMHCRREKLVAVETKSFRGNMQDRSCETRNFLIPQTQEFSRKWQNLKLWMSAMTFANDSCSDVEVANLIFHYFTKHKSNEPLNRAHVGKGKHFVEFAEAEKRKHSLNDISRGRIVSSRWHLSQMIWTFRLLTRSRLTFFRHLHHTHVKSGLVDLERHSISFILSSLTRLAIKQAQDRQGRKENDFQSTKSGKIEARSIVKQKYPW